MLRASSVLRTLHIEGCGLAKSDIPPLMEAMHEAPVPLQSLLASAGYCSKCGALTSGCLLFSGVVLARAQDRERT